MALSSPAQASSPHPASTPGKFAALRIALIYAIVAAVWIITSDRLLGVLVGDSVSRLTWLQTLKGCAYVLVTALMLYVLVRRAVATITQSNRALGQSEASYRRLIETAGEGIVLVDPQGQMTFANRAMATMLGCGEQELVGRPLLEFADGAGRPIIEETLRQGRVEAQQWELRFRRRDGSDLWTNASTSAVTDSEGHYSGMLLMLTDISQRREARQRLEESEQRFRAIFDQSGMGIALYDPSGRVVQANRALQVLLGYSAEELERLTYLQLVHPEEVQSSRDDFGQLLAGQRPQIQAEKRYLRRDGQTIWVRRTGSAVRDAAGKVRYLVGMVEDISERRRAREEIQRLNQTLEQRVRERTHQLEQAKGQLEAFAYSMSHDLRTPLQSMQQMARDLLAKPPVAADETAGELGRRLVAATARLDCNIEDLLEYARLGPAQIPAEKVNLIVVVMQVLGQLEAEIQRRSAEVSVQEPLPQVLGHRLTLVPAVTNLISNAITFVPEDRRPQVRIWADQHDGWVRMWVQDNGVGIAPQDQERIFNAFHRLDPQHYPAGAGLGLAISRHGIERMGGRIGVESELGRGTRFWVELRAG